MKKYLIYAMSLLIVGASFSACSNEEDDIFEASPSDRLNQAMEDYTALLCKPANGWAMQYFADNEDEGGYTFLMKFDKNTSVTIVSNNRWTGNAYKEETSMFDLIADNGPVLTFNTFNDVFHIFSTPEDLPSTPENEAGYGHNGDYEFIVMDATDDLITLKGKKTAIRVLMTPLADDTDWKQYFTELKAKSRSLFNDKFDPLLLDLGEKRFIVSGASTGVFSMYPEGGDAITETVKYPYLINFEGIRFYKEVEETGVQQIYFNDQGSFSLEGQEESCLRQTKELNGIFLTKTLGWRLVADNIGGSFATVLENIATETKEKLKRNFNSIDFIYYASQKTYALSFRNSGTSAAAYIYGTETPSEDGLSIKFDISTTEGNNNGKNRLRDIPSLTTFINLLNSTDLVMSTENPLAPTKITFKSRSNENDYFTVTLN